MKEWKFWMYNMVGSIFWAISINLLGILFVDNYETILDNFWKVSTGLIIAIAIYIYLFKREGFKQYMRDKQQEIIMKSEQKNIRK